MPPSARDDVKPKSPEEYTVGWICALPKEQTAARAMLDQIHPHPHPPIPPRDENAYILGSIDKHNIAIACLPKGKVGTSEAAAAAAEMMRTFPSIKIGFLVGIGGGVPPKVRLGDVVVGTEIVQWDFGKEETDGCFKRTGAVNQPPRTLSKALTTLETVHESEGTEIHEHLDTLKKKWPRLARKYTWSESLKDPLCVSETQSGSSSYCYPEDDLEKAKRRKLTNTVHERLRDLPERQPGEVCVHYGLIASGNKVVKNGMVRDNINESLDGKVLCFEMEAAGMVNFPCLVVRGICDYADSQKNDDWQEYAAAVAAAFTKEFLGYVRPDDIIGERPMSEILDQLKAVSDDITTIKSKLDKKEDIEILNWLTPIDFDDQQADYFNRRQPGTGRWLLDSIEYQDWLEANKKTLFCPGMPGAGKTILTSIVLDDLTSRFSNHPEIGIAYIYCNFRRKDEQTAQSLLASLLKQLSRYQSTLPTALKELHSKSKRTRPSIEDILQALESVSKGYERVFIVIDALDECQVSDNCREILLSSLFQLQAISGANIFATSRDLPQIAKNFENNQRLEIRAHDADVQSFLDAQITDSNEDILINNREEIKTKIANVIDGMFLLARLHFETVKHETTLKDIRKTLETLKSGQNAYDDAYKEAITRITGQNLKWKSLAFRVLSWITLATRPLTTLELQHALAVELGQPQLDKDNFTETTKMISVCAGLVTIDEESGIIRLVHYTTQEYFQRTWRDWFPEAETDITEICATYLSYSVFKTGPSPNEDDFKARLQANALYDYATKNFGYHARRSLSRSTPLVLAFLKSESAVLACAQAIEVDRTWIRWGGEKFPISTGLHMAAYLGLREPVALLLESADIEAKDVNGKTALIHAAENGHEAVVELLINKGADIEAKDTKLGWTALSWAANKGHEAVVELLIYKGADIEAKDTQWGQTTLGWAAESGHEAVVELLVNNGADIEAKDDDGRTALICAAKTGHETVVKLLINNGADIEAKDTEWGQTALSWAAESGYEAVVKLLINNGADIEAKDGDGQTAIVWAAKKKHYKVVELLRNNGAKYDGTELEGSNSGG